MEDFQASFFPHFKASLWTKDTREGYRYWVSPEIDSETNGKAFLHRWGAVKCDKPNDNVEKGILGLALLIGDPQQDWDTHGLQPRLG
jgi:hypothetical protein